MKRSVAGAIVGVSIYESGQWIAGWYPNLKLVVFIGCVLLFAFIVSKIDNFFDEEK